MKFSQVPIGGWFRFQGERYQKAGPLTATHEASGRQRMIPRSADIESADAVPAPLNDAARTVSDVHGEFEAFYAEALALIAELGDAVPTERLRLVRERLHAARTRFLDRIKR